jgi:hypothetical protein
LAILSALADTPPGAVEPHTSRDACLEAADKKNRTEPLVLTAPPALGVRFVCLEIVQAESI